MFKDLLIVKQKNNVDKRGSLRETFNKKILKKKFVFEYCTTSKKNVLRGFHFQTKNKQSKYLSRGKKFLPISDIELPYNVDVCKDNFFSKAYSSVFKISFFLSLDISHPNLEVPTTILVF